jgi:hypothetical protein
MKGNEISFLQIRVLEKNKRNEKQFLSDHFMLLFNSIDHNLKFTIKSHFEVIL